MVEWTNWSRETVRHQFDIFYNFAVQVDTTVEK